MLGMGRERGREVKEEAVSVPRDRQKKAEMSCHAIRSVFRTVSPFVQRGIFAALLPPAPAATNEDGAYRYRVLRALCPYESVHPNNRDGRGSGSSFLFVQIKHVPSD